jgi:hypothetical protein
MGLSHVDPAAALECVVVLFQVLGVAGLCMYRLFPGTRWARRGKVGFIVAMVGLGAAGAICGRQDSAFALFAGGTMTALLIGMTIGGGAAGASLPAGDWIGVDAPLAPGNFQAS